MPLYIVFPEWLRPEIIPGLPFRWYGLMYLVAFSVAFYFYRKQVRERRYPMSDDDVSSLFFWAIFGLLIGARVFSTLVYETSNLYRREPWLVFWPFRNGKFTGLTGMSYHGGTIGCITGFLLWSLKKKHDVREIADMFAGSIPIGYTFGRIGNFINAELYGRVTASPVGMVFPHAEMLPVKTPGVAEIAEKAGISLPLQGLVNLPRHPSQLYEAFFEGVFLWACIWLLRKKSPFRGFCFGLYIAGYGLIRFIIEYFRQPDSDLGYRLQFVPNDLPLALAHPLTSISTGQLFSFCMILAGAGIWVASALYPAPPYRYVWQAPAPSAGGAPSGVEKKAARAERRKLRRKFR
jgi:phosphatidylglycerol:prolipoprotein diacylglycerol transferase